MERVVIRTMGANSAYVEKVIVEFQKYEKNGICYHHVRDYDEDILEMSYKNGAPKALVDDLVRFAVETLGPCLYSIGDVTLEEQVISLLKIRRRRLSVAESFTGGGLARRIVSVPGASEVYFEGLNTYNSLSKIKRLGVKPHTIETFGAVSEQTAYEMVLGLLNTGDCDIAVATTGFAGPQTDSSGLPVGLCYIAVGTRERIRVYQYQFDGSRKDITEKAINYALYLVYKQIKDIE